jgi:hypothetical protein
VRHREPSLPVKAGVQGAIGNGRRRPRSITPDSRVAAGRHCEQRAALRCIRRHASPSLGPRNLPRLGRVCRSDITEWANNYSSDRSGSRRSKNFEASCHARDSRGRGHLVPKFSFRLRASSEGIACGSSPHARFDLARARCCLNPPKQLGARIAPSNSVLRDDGRRRRRRSTKLVVDA